MPKLSIDLGGRNIFRGSVLGHDADRHALDPTQGIRLTLTSPIGSLLTGEDIEALREGPLPLRLGCADMRTLLVRISTSDGIETIMAEDEDEIYDLSVSPVTDLIRIPETAVTA